MRLTQYGGGGDTRVIQGLRRVSLVLRGCPELFPARASEQGNVIGSVSVYIYIYIYMSSKKNCN